MKPTAEMIEAGRAAIMGVYTDGSEGGYIQDVTMSTDAEAAIAAAMPLIEQAVAEQIAEQIELFSEQCGGEPIKADIAAWIARAYPDGYDECCGGGEVVPYDDEADDD